MEAEPMSDSPTETYVINPRPRRPPGDVPWYVAVALGLLATILVLAVFLLLRDDDDQIETTGTTTSVTTATLPSTSEASTTQTSETSSTTASSTTATTSGSSSTTAASTTSSASTTTVPTTTSTTAVDPALYATAVWPWFESTTRYTSPTDAAEGFAEDFVGFDDPVVGQFQQGDSRSGEVELRPFTDGPVTVVFVRQLGQDNSWWILGSAAENIEIGDPGPLEVIDSPLTVSGRAMAFEGVVDVVLRADGAAAPLIEDTVTGGASTMERFEDEFVWNDPDEGSGALLLSAQSMEDGSVLEASVIRLHFSTS